jgi:hypothetical protein
MHSRLVANRHRRTPDRARRAMAQRASSGSSNRPLTPGNLPTGPAVRAGSARRRSEGFGHLPLSLNNATCHLLHLHSERRQGVAVRGDVI